MITINGLTVRRGGTRYSHGTVQVILARQLRCTKSLLTVSLRAHPDTVTR